MSYHLLQISNIICNQIITLFGLIVVFVWSFALHSATQLVRFPLDSIRRLVVAYVMLFDGWLPRIELNLLIDFDGQMM